MNRVRELGTSERTGWAIREERVRTPRPDPRAEPEAEMTTGERAAVREETVVRGRRDPRIDSEYHSPYREEYSSSPPSSGRAVETARTEPAPVDATARTDPPFIVTPGVGAIRAHNWLPAERPPPSEATNAADRLVRLLVGDGARISESEYYDRAAARRAGTPLPEPPRSTSLPGARDTYRHPASRNNVGGRQASVSGDLPLARAEGSLAIRGRNYPYRLGRVELQDAATTPAETTLRRYVASGRFTINSPRGGGRVQVVEVIGPVGEGAQRTGFRIRGSDGNVYVAGVIDPHRTGMTGEAAATAVRNDQGLSAPLRGFFADASRETSTRLGRRVIFTANPNLADSSATALGIRVQEDFSSGGAARLTPEAEIELRIQGVGGVIDAYEQLGIDANNAYAYEFLRDPAAIEGLFGGRALPTRPNYRTGYVELAFPDIRRGGLAQGFANSYYRQFPDGTVEIIASDPF